MLYTLNIYSYICQLFIKVKKIIREELNSMGFMGRMDISQYVGNVVQGKESIFLLWGKPPGGFPILYMKGFA